MSGNAKIQQYIDKQQSIDDHHPVLPAVSINRAMPENRII
jgi:hypothetical protein